MGSDADESAEAPMTCPDCRRMREAIRRAIIYTNVEKRSDTRLALIRDTLKAALAPTAREQEKKPMPCGPSCQKCGTAKLDAGTRCDNCGEKIKKPADGKGAP